MKGALFEEQNTFRLYQPLHYIDFPETSDVPPFSQTLRTFTICCDRFNYTGNFSWLMKDRLGRISASIGDIFLKHMRRTVRACASKCVSLVAIDE
jgi:hypothetical protein